MAVTIRASRAAPNAPAPVSGTWATTLAPRPAAIFSMFFATVGYLRRLPFGCRDEGTSSSGNPISR